ncbi:MAG: site-specific DNA-methyltransferase, partial [Candidatus Diapherotrites archaeon]|nr:site-specific DNA-methyltransferase [Candidatus Diapherotrites archaeon]
LKDGFERIYHFAKTDKFYINFDDIKQPVKESTIERRSRLREGIDDKSVYSSTPRGLSFVRYKSLSSDTALPSNVLYCASETRNVGHSAAFPIQIPDFFIKLLTKSGDTILDPFCGSGTTIISALINNRIGIGIEIEKKYFELSYKRILKESYDKMTEII